MKFLIVFAYVVVCASVPTVHELSTRQVVPDWLVQAFFWTGFLTGFAATWPWGNDPKYHDPFDIRSGSLVGVFLARVRQWSLVPRILVLVPACAAWLAIGYFLTALSAWAIGIVQRFFFAGQIWPWGNIFFAASIVGFILTGITGTRLSKLLAERRKIFVSYRRDDAAPYAARIRDRVARALGERNVFMDIDNLKAGQRFDRELEKALAQCDVFLAVIGPRWLTTLQARARQGERDFVCEEIAAALKQELLVIPVVTDGATLPPGDQLPNNIRALVLHQKHDIRHERFGRDVEDLIEAIKSGRKRQGTLPPADSSESRPAVRAGTPPAVRAGTPHEKYANVVYATDGKLEPAPGYDWVSNKAGDFQVIRTADSSESRPAVRAGKPHEKYADSSESRPAVRSGTPHGKYANVVYAKDGKLKPAPGYDWVNNKAGDFQVIWTSQLPP